MARASENRPVPQPKSRILPTSRPRRCGSSACIKSSHGVLYVIGALFKRVRIPFAARRGKEISAVNVDRRGNLIQWIRNSVNNRCPKRRCVLRVQLLAPVLLQAVLGTAVEGVLLATSIYAA